MKKSLVILLPIFIAAVFMFSACNSDTQGPKIYFLGVDGSYIENGDTTVLLFSKYVDPGVFCEDNATKTSNIIVEDNAAEELSVTTAGYLKKAEEVTITYTAKDEAENISTKERIVTIYNISQPFAKSYATTRTSLHLDNSVMYNSTVSADSRIPGRLRFPKVYSYETTEGGTNYFRVNADLYDPLNISDEFSEDIGYMGTASNKETPFFEGMSYEEAKDTILTFTYLRIDAQEYSDTAANETAFIQGVTEEGTDLPLSRIEYLAGSKTILRIVLELNVTKADSLGNPIVDRITETYTPND